MTEGIRKFLAEVLWWAHIGVILGGVVLGVVLSWWMVVIIFIGHRIHLHLAGGCIMTKLQRSLGGLPNGVGFLQDAVMRLTGRKIGKRGVMLLDLGIVGGAITMGIILDGVLWGGEEEIMAQAFEMIEEGMEG